MIISFEDNGSHTSIDADEKFMALSNAEKIIVLDSIIDVAEEYMTQLSDPTTIEELERKLLELQEIDEMTGL